MKTIKQLAKDLRDYRDGIPLVRADYNSLDFIIDKLESIVPTNVLLEQELTESQKSDCIMSNIQDIINEVKIFAAEAPLTEVDSAKINLVIKKLMEIKPIKVWIKHELTDSQKLELLGLFHDWYCNTDQDTEDFAKEFYYVVEDIIHGRVPVKLMFLDDYQDLLVKECPYLEDKILKAMSLEIKEED